MPNQPDPRKVMLGCRIPRDLYEKLRKLAKVQNTNISALVLQLIGDEVADVALSPVDMEDVENEIRVAVLRCKNADKKRSKGVAVKRD